MCTKSCKKYLGSAKQYKHLRGSGVLSLADIMAGMKRIPILGPAIQQAEEAKKRMEGKTKKPAIVPVKEE